MKTFFKIFGGLLAFIIIGISIFLWTFDLNTYRGYITEKLSASLGHPVTIDRLEMKLSLIPTIKISSIRIGNPDGFQSDKPLFFSNSAEVTLAVAPLLSHRLEIQKALFDTSFINLVEQVGQKNWTVPDTSKSAPKRASSNNSWFQEMRFDNIAFTKTTVLYTSETKNSSVEILDASIKQLKLFSFTLNYDKHTFKVSGNGNDLMLFLSGEPNYLFNLEVSHPAFTAKLNGNIGDTKKFQKMVFKLTLSSQNIKESLKKFKIDNTKIPALPFEVQAVLQGNLNALDIANWNMNLGSTKLSLNSTGTIEGLTQTPQIKLEGTISLSDVQLAQSWGLKPISSQFGFTANPTKITLENLTLQANRSDVQIFSEITHFSKHPQISLAVNSEYLDTNDFLFQDPTPYVAAPAPIGVPTKRFISDKNWDLSILKSFDVSARFNLPHFRFSNQLGGYFGLEGNLTLKDGKLETDSLKGLLLDGSVTGKLALDTRTTPPVYQAQLSGKSFNLNNIKSLNSIIQDATLDLTLEGQASGNSLYQVLSSLNGNSLIELSQGVIVSDWFNELPIVEQVARSKTSALTFSNSDKISQVLCGAAKINVQNGVLTSQNNIVLETSSVDFQLGGSLDLNTEAINFKIRPIINSADKKLNALISMGQLVSITGTLSNPQPVLDAAGIANQVNTMLNPTVTEPYTLCQQVLNRQTLAQKTAQTKRATVLSFPKAETEEPKQEAPKDQLRQKLLNTLQDVLKNDGAY